MSSAYLTLKTDTGAEMAITRGIFGDKANYDDRIITDLEELGEKVLHLRKGFNLRIVLTSGSFDLVHLGHLDYLAKARSLGDLLIIGVDSDAKIRERKGEGRPMVPEDERLKVLAHTRSADILYLKTETDPKWGLIKKVEADVLVFSEDHGYTSEQFEELKQYCGEIQVLERQSIVTSSERIRQMYMGLGEKLGPELAKQFKSFVDGLPNMIDEIVRGGR